MTRRRKILIYTHAMVGGGAERVCALLASGFAELGDDVLLATDFQSNENSAYVGSRVRCLGLGTGHMSNVLALARVLRREKPDVALSALGISNLKLLIASVLAWNLSRTILSYHGFASNEPSFLSRVSYLLTPLSTRLAAATVCVSDSLLAELVENWHASKRRTLRIFNPVSIRAQAHQPDIVHPVVLAIGRLAPQKNFTSLVRAFALLRHKHARLVILGEGPEQEMIETEVARLGLTERVSLPGYVSEPWRMYGLASCLAVSSHLETFSLVTVEALANGLPVVSTACKGPEEILGHGQFGTIVPCQDAPAMAAALDACLDDPGDPAPRIARAAAFSVEAALASYGALFDRVAAAATRGKR